MKAGTAEEHIANVEKKKVCRHLVVDDAATNRSILKLYLESQKLVVDEADSGDTAMEKLRELGKEGYDVIWTDLSMKGMGGLELAREARKFGFDRYLVVLSGNVKPEQQVQLKEVGVDLVCLKPLRKKTLLELSVMRLYV